MLAGLGPGMLAVGLLTVNNLRDIDGDRVAGKRTLAVRFGSAFAKVEFAASLLVAALVPLLLWILVGAPVGVLAASAVCLIGIPALLAVLRWKPGERLDGALAGTGRLLVLYALAFCLGWSL